MVTLLLSIGLIALPCFAPGNECSDNMATLAVYPFDRGWLAVELGRSVEMSKRNATGIHEDNSCDCPQFWIQPIVMPQIMSEPIPLEFCWWGGEHEGDFDVVAGDALMFTRQTRTMTGRSLMI